MLPTNANPIASLSSLIAPGGIFSGFGLTAPQDSNAGPSALGVSTAAAPLISAPATRQSPGFQASIAPPTRPSDPAIAPPTGSMSENSIGGTGASMKGPMEKLAYIAAFKLEMAAAQSNGASGTKSSVLEMAGAKGK